MKIYLYGVLLSLSRTCSRARTDAMNCVHVTPWPSSPYWPGTRSAARLLFCFPIKAGLSQINASTTTLTNEKFSHEWSACLFWPEQACHSFAKKRDLLIPVQHRGAMSQDIIILSSSILIGYSNAFQIANFLSSFIPQEPTLTQLEAFPYPTQLTENEHRRISSSQLTQLTGDQLTERQGGGATAITILVVFIIAFATSVLTNLVFISVVTGGAGAGEGQTNKLFWV